MKDYMTEKKTIGKPKNYIKYSILLNTLLSLIFYLDTFQVINCSISDDEPECIANLSKLSD